MKTLLDCANVTFVGLWKDTDGVYGTMPLYEISDQTPEEWAALGRRTDGEKEEEEDRL